MLYLYIVYLYLYKGRIPCGRLSIQWWWGLFDPLVLVRSMHPAKVTLTAKLIEGTLIITTLIYFLMNSSSKSKVAVRVTSEVFKKIIIIMIIGATKKSYIHLTVYLKNVSQQCIYKCIPSPLPPNFNCKTRVSDRIIGYASILNCWWYSWNSEPI